MLDLKEIRRDPEPVRAALARRRDGSDARLDRVLRLDEAVRAFLRPPYFPVELEEQASTGEPGHAGKAEACALLTALR